MLHDGKREYDVVSAALLASLAPAVTRLELEDTVVMDFPVPGTLPFIHLTSLDITCNIIEWLHANGGLQGPDPTISYEEFCSFFAGLPRLSFLRLVDALPFMASPACAPWLLGSDPIPMPQTLTKLWLSADARKQSSFALYPRLQVPPTAETVWHFDCKTDEGGRDIPSREQIFAAALGKYTARVVFLGNYRDEKAPIIEGGNMVCPPEDHISHVAVFTPDTVNWSYADHAPLQHADMSNVEHFFVTGVGLYSTVDSWLSLFASAPHMRRLDVVEFGSAEALLTALSAPQWGSPPLPALDTLLLGVNRNPKKISRFFDSRHVLWTEGSFSDDFIFLLGSVIEHRRQLGSPLHVVGLPWQVQHRLSDVSGLGVEFVFIESTS
ncbi:hypothetical protein K488DRAFT_86794 [Vararia minispora EC-137]|uniref:Uncharacterized protein n=1 Tax=Vararia minispora EC-137 TaxID=1314806 RepID=A0ACB8QI29_9AGAM|nr:hypothetical protein K488DRAFT_86794 [Vararia minispora EC-137]